MCDSRIHVKNPKTGKPEAIRQRRLRVEAWGLVFFVDSELDAYKAANAYAAPARQALVEYAQGAETWMVTVFNSAHSWTR